MYKNKHNLHKIYIEKQKNGVHDVIEHKKLYIQAFETPCKHEYTWSYMRAKTAKIEGKNGFYRGKTKNIMKNTKFEEIFDNKHMF